MWTPEHREIYKDDGRRYPSDLTDAEWNTIAPILSGYVTYTKDLREMVNACLYREKTGCQWRAIPKDFGAWQTVRGWSDRFRRDGVWADLAGLLTRAVRQQRGRPPEPSTGILDSQSVLSGPQKGARGVDAHKKVKGIKRHGIKRHVLACALGFLLAILVTPANVHDTKAAGMVLDRAAENGWHVQRLKVDGIYHGARMDTAAQRHHVEVQPSTPPADRTGFTPLPLRWRLEQTFGTLTNRYRSLTRNLTQSETAAEDAVLLANFHRVLLAYVRGNSK